MLPLLKPYTIIFILFFTEIMMVESVENNYHLW